MRLMSYRKGYLRGSPDLIIHNLNKRYMGLIIEFKSPNGNGVLSEDQSKMMRQYHPNGYKTLVSNDYDRITECLLEYFKDVRMKCSFCPRKFVSYESIKNTLRVIIKGFKEVVCRRAMNKLPRHVKHTFYCEECDRVYPIRYIDRHHMT